MQSNHSFLAPDLRISRIITGLWQVADMERDGKSLDLDEAAKALLPYIEAGLTTFDMADHYGSSELIVGRLHKKYVPKETIQLLTKWVPTPGKLSKQSVREAIELSLKRMQLDTLDLLQYHAWNYADPSWLDQLYWLQELREEGLIKHIGLTNFDTAHVRMVLKSDIKAVSNQVCFSLLDQRAKQGMLDLCAENGIQLLAFGTVAGGFLSEKWLNTPEPDTNQLTTWSEMKYKRFIDQIGTWQNFQDLLQTLSQLAQDKSVDIANIASAYILAQKGVGGIIIGARLGKNAHIASNLRLFDNPLSDSELDQVAIALTQLKPIGGDCGDEYRKPPFLTASGDLSHHIDNFPAPYSTKIGNDSRTKVLSGTIWEDMAGFSRAVKKGNQIHISGTTATNGSNVVGGNDPTSQTHFIIDKIEGALQSLGSRLEDVVRTRIFIRNIYDWEAITRAHGARFKDIQPANTMVQANLIGEEYLVEIEATALVL
jgi:aryl-alcohol dehydrogenase-like predicted oxidoreductase/enamine deaminase RidA (YjgF/YER057c/UK114 family)